jgi:hypothetical protein
MTWCWVREWKVNGWNLGHELTKSVILGKVRGL